MILESRDWLCPRRHSMNSARLRQSAVFVLATLTILSLFYVGDHWRTDDGGIVVKSPTLAISRPSQSSKVNNPLDGCYHIYLDVGSNVGIQVRKLFEPQLYPNSGVFSVFDTLFGKYEQRNLSQVCSVGFEPNPNHEARLKQLQASYRSCGWPVTFFTRTAVSDKAGTVAFMTDEDKGNLEWGGSIVKDNVNLKSSLGNVQMVRLSDFVLDLVATRRLPKQADAPDMRPPAVIMKMDIEGGEVETLADLILTGSFQHITKTMVEFHHRLAANEERKAVSVALEAAVQTLRKISAQLDVSQMDDESYGGSTFELPKCQ